MDSIQIKTGIKRISVSVDGLNAYELVFNPDDVLFLERFHRLYRKMDEKAEKYKQRQGEIAEPELDARGIPVEVTSVTSVLKDIDVFFREQIDTLFGEGTSHHIFGDAVYSDPDVYVQLISGVSGYIQPVRGAKIAKYVPAAEKPATRTRRTRPKKK